ncbi:unnamed protein product [Symbiodinium sp. CCMP2592]|nr:unnamed protein product [Symbiodinium sp. CCMP2592]
MQGAVVSRAALAEMTHTQESASPLPFGPPALAQGAWRQAAVSSDTAVPETSQIAVRNRNRAEMESRALAPEDRPPAQPVDYDQNEEEGTRGHMIDAARDDARQDRSFARSTAKLTPAQFAELADTYHNPAGHATSSAAQSSTVVVEEAEPENLLAPAGEPTSFRMLREAAPADRWTAKILAYPCFDHGFRQAIVATRLAEIPFVLSMDAGTPEQFAAVSLNWTASSAKSEHDLLAPRTQMLEQYWVFVKAAESLFVESLGYQMGFARCSKVPRERSAKSIAHFQREMAIRALAAPAAGKLFFSLGDSTARRGEREKQKWAKRLKAIADRAGEHARPEGVHDAEGSSLPAKMIKELVQEVSREFVPLCAQEDDTIEDAEVGRRRGIFGRRWTQFVSSVPGALRSLPGLLVSPLPGNVTGLKILPPIDKCTSELILEAIDLLDAQVFDWLLLLCRMGAIVYLHLGVPCATFSVARAQLFEANELLCRCLLLFEAVVQAGGDASIENPKDSLIWQVPQVQQLKVRLHLYNVDFDQCEYGSPHRKPTRLLVSHAALLALARACSGGHLHVPLRGVTRSETGQKIFKTKAAQVYPSALCTAWAIAVAAIVQKSVQQFAASFALTAPSAERKRSLGSQIAWKGHRQSAAARLAAAGGYQLKRGAAKPLLDVECEPGQAIQWSLQVRHPFTVQPALPDKIVDNIKFIVSSPQALVARRSERLQFWQQRALTLLPETDRILRSIADEQRKQELLDSIDAILEAGTLEMPPVTQWKAVLDLLLKESLAWKATLAGFDKSYLHSSCFQLSENPDLRARQVAFNQKQVEQAAGLLAPVNGTERYLSVSSGHTTQFLKALWAGCRTSEGSLATNGFLSKEVLCGKDPVLREVMLHGWSWVIVSWAVEECYPDLPKLAERALNSSNSAFQAQSELELALHILDLASGMQQPDFKALAAEACHAGPVKNYSSSIAKWLGSYSNKGDFAKFLGIFTKEFGDNYNVGEEFWVMAAGNMFAEVPLLRLAMLATNFTAPKNKIQDGYARLLTRSDWDKLKGNKLQKQILDMDQKLFQAYQKVEARFSDLAAIRAFGMLLIRCCMHVLQKEKMGRETKVFESMDEIFEAFEQTALPSSSSSAGGAAQQAGLVSLGEAYDALFLAKQKIEIAVGKHYTYQNKLWKLREADSNQLVLELLDLFQSEEVTIETSQCWKHLRISKLPAPVFTDKALAASREPHASCSTEALMAEVWLTMLKVCPKLQPKNIWSLIGVVNSSRKAYALKKIPAGELCLFPSTDAISKITTKAPADKKKKMGQIRYKEADYYILPPAMFKTSEDNKVSGCIAPYWWLDPVKEPCMTWEEKSHGGITAWCLANQKKSAGKKSEPPSKKPKKA